MTRVILYLTISLLWAANLAEAAGISGRVVSASDGSTVSGAEIEVRWYGDGKNRTARIGETGDDGRFNFDPEQILATTTPLPRSLSVVFVKSGFLTVTMLLERTPDAPFRAEDKVVRLKPSSGTAALKPEEETRLRPKKSATGGTLFVLPYVDLSADQAEQIRINRLVKMYLFAGIQKYLQELKRKNVTVPIEHFSLNELEAEIEIYNTERVLTYGRELNALAVAGGWAELGQATEEGEQLRLNSSYVIIPSVAGFEGNDLLWEDQLPVGTISSRRIAERLNRQWGRKTVMAIALTAFNRALQAEEEERARRLGVIQRFLNAELKDAGADEPLVPELAALLTLVKQAKFEEPNP